MSPKNVPKCIICNLVVDELLTFVQNKHDVMDSESLVRICSLAFSTEDIEKAKLLLFQSISTEIRQVKRQKNEGKFNKDLYDIIEIFKSLDPEMMPTFVARNLNALPAIHFDHLDGSKLLKDILILQNEIQLIKSSYVTTDQLLRAKEEIIKINIENCLSLSSTGRGGSAVNNTFKHYNNDNEPQYRNINIRGGACLDNFDYDSGRMGLTNLTSLPSQQATLGANKVLSIKVCPKVDIPGTTPVVLPPAKSVHFVRENDSGSLAAADRAAARKTEQCTATERPASMPETATVLSQYTEEVVTGEEKEDELFGHRARLYIFVSGKWKERGTGIVKILKHKETNKLRVVMRCEQVHKICLNHVLTSDIVYNPKDEKTWIFAANDFSEGELTLQKFCLRFSNKEIALQFKNAVDNAIQGKPVDAAEAEQKTTNHDQKVDEDVVLVNETQSSADDKQKAKDLMLPENFYMYKSKEPCDGCRGCSDDDSKSDTEPPRTVTVTALAAALATQNVTTQSTLFTPLKYKLTSFQSPANSVYGTPGNDKTLDTSAFRTPLGSIGSNTVTSSPSNSSTYTVSDATNKENLFSQKSSIFSNFGDRKYIFGTPLGAQAPLFGAGDSQTPVGTKSSLLAPPKLNTLNTSSEIKAPVKSIFSCAQVKPEFGESSIFGGAGISSNKSIFGFPADKPKDEANPEVKSIFGGNEKSITLFSGTSQGSIIGPGSLKSNQPKSGGIFVTGEIYIFGTNTEFIGFKYIKSATSADRKHSNKLRLKIENSFAFQAAVLKFTSLLKSGPGIENKPDFKWDGSGQNLFGSGQKKESEKKEEGELTKHIAQPCDKNVVTTEEQGVVLGELPLKIENNLTFAALSTSAPVFEKKVDFKWPSHLSSGHQWFSSTTNKDSKKESGTGDGDDASGKAEKELDPHYQPIVPLPDMIQVATGEEDEKKIFGERCKIDRYDNKNKEWKERGVGELKILHHPQINTYRLLLRRDQKADFKWPSHLSSGHQWSSSTTNKDSKNESGPGEDASGKAEKELDPHYQPIVPLPDKIVVTTGEEDEKKIFGERGKIYRYDDKTKEWKERGVGELKILHHPQINTYRLLLRREQVHKAVLNMPIHMDLELMPMKNRETAWTFAGLNFAESTTGQYEMLAVRLRNITFANTFRDHVVQCVRSLQAAAATAIREQKEAQEKKEAPATVSKDEGDVRETKFVSAVAPLRLPKHLQDNARADMVLNAAAQQAESAVSVQSEALWVKPTTDSTIKTEAKTNRDSIGGTPTDGKQVNFQEEQEYEKEEDDDDDDDDENSEDASLQAAAATAIREQKEAQEKKEAPATVSKDEGDVRETKFVSAVAPLRLPKHLQDNARADMVLNAAAQQAESAVSVQSEALWVKPTTDSTIKTEAKTNRDSIGGTPTDGKQVNFQEEQEYEKEEDDDDDDDDENSEDASLQAVAATAIREQKEPQEKKEAPVTVAKDEGDVRETKFVSAIAPLRLPKHLQDNATADMVFNAEAQQAESAISVQSEALWVKPTTDSTIKTEAKTNGDSIGGTPTDGKQKFLNFQEEQEYKEEEDDDDDDDDENYEDAKEANYECEGEAIVKKGEEESSCAHASIKVLFEKDIYLPKLLVTDAVTGEILSDMLIDTDTQFQLSGDSCKWTGKDYTSNDPVDKTVTINFYENEAAIYFYDIVETIKFAYNCNQRPGLIQNN